MISMIPKKMSLQQVKNDLIAFDTLLKDNLELEETGSGSLQEFFKAHPDLLLLIGSALGGGLVPAAYLPECSIVHEFRADYAVANKDRSKFLFIEFENAKKESIFAAKALTKSNTSYQWSKTFEHGFSQVVDWYFRLDDYLKTSKIDEHFGAPKINYVGIIVLGRDHFLKQAGLTQRFEWRRDHTVINNQPLRCYTFDGLAKELRGHYESLLDLVTTS